MYSLIDRYDFMKKMKVDERMVDAYKEKILRTLENKTYIHLADEFTGLSNYSIECSQQTEEQELEKFSGKLSKFMAYQEALHDMVTSGKLIPVKITNTYSVGSFNVRIHYAIRNGMSTLSGDRDINIPILEHNTFMLKPSLMNK
ncbi:hypothetical protein [Natronincola ferrireducens]|uniref:Uncharacterized protein n=1 Tax=Natronincola ferrireducens TaxID=393762 RepID=A0A1G9IFV0_9FIRM|nr:hypothetical protein [Natronincola ferrireducens]SDL24130.1 hypothetical protein SAMN05660472_02860 [Natronincola ferrireducens]